MKIIAHCKGYEEVYAGGCGEGGIDGPLIVHELFLGGKECRLGYDLRPLRPNR